MSANIEPVTGRYLQLEIEAARHRVYFEEAGKGIPLLCLHAGGNSRNPTAANYLRRHDVHGGEVSAGIVSGLIAPQSPDRERWETLWHYASGGPGVFQGDLFYYLVNGDLRNQPLDIDTETCPVYLLSGEYDYSAPPEGAEEICRRIKGAHFQKMAEMGHFPMSENPQRFREYLLPVLADFHARG